MIVLWQIPRIVNDVIAAVQREGNLNCPAIKIFTIFDPEEKYFRNCILLFYFVEEPFGASFRCIKKLGLVFPVDWD